MTDSALPQIEVDGPAFLIDAGPVAERFGMSVDAFREAVRRGEIVTLCETGQDEDAGSTRLTFRRGTLHWRFVLHPDNTVTEDPVILGRASTNMEGQDRR